MEYTEHIEDEEVSTHHVQHEAQTEPISRELIDSLPYIDAFDDALQLEAQRLIDQEARTFRNTHQPSAVTVSFTSESLNKEFERLQSTNGVGWTSPSPGLEPVNFPEANAPLSEWESAVERAKIYYEYLKNRAELLELQQQFGANAWLEHNKTAELFRDYFKKLLAGFKTRTEQVNIERKQMQLQAKAKLANLERAFEETAKRNFEIEAACARLEASIPANHVQ